MEYYVWDPGYTGRDKNKGRLSKVKFIADHKNRYLQ